MRKDQSIESTEKKYITRAIILGLIKTGAILALAITAPGVLKLFKDFGKRQPWDDYYPSTIERVAKKLYRQGIVEIKTENGVPIVKMTDKGKTAVLKYDLDNLAIKPQKKWDGKWRLVIFDISERYKQVRELIRRKLKEMGFYRFQDSVFIYPFPCEKEIIYLREILDVPHFIKLIRADRIENDQDLRRIFNLK